MDTPSPLHWIAETTKKNGSVSSSVCCNIASAKSHWNRMHCGYSFWVWARCIETMNLIVSYFSEIFYYLLFACNLIDFNCYIAININAGHRSPCAPKIQAKKQQKKITELTNIMRCNRISIFASRTYIWLHCKCEIAQRTITVCVCLKS